MIDLKTSRRDMYLECTYWNQDEDEDYVENSEIVHSRIPTGFFKAKEINAYQISNQVVAESFMIDEEVINILTYDKIKKLKINDIVKVKGREKLYRVDNIQVSPFKQQRFYNTTNYSNSYYISLRG